MTTLDGQKVLEKTPLETLFKRARVFIGPTTWSNYTIEADVRAPTRRRQMGDVGITAQRYSLVLYGNVAAAEDSSRGNPRRRAPVRAASRGSPTRGTG